jgi:hypothetical protein
MDPAREMKKLKIYTTIFLVKYYLRLHYMMIVTSSC